MAKDWSAAEFNISSDPKQLIFHIKRFRTSPHCRDLLCIAAIAFFFAVCLAVPVADSTYHWFSTALEASSDKGASELYLALLGIALGVIGWAYQSANTRFGVVDIFAAEIATLCRVAAVAEFIPNYIRGYNGGDAFPPVKFDQDYLIVFNENAKDLEVLDGDVVRYVTQYYIYMKALLDVLARGSDIVDARGGREQAALSTIYNAFLAFESARQAISVLMDNSAERQEFILAAMLSEVPAYLFLYVERGKMDTYRRKRIEARLKKYQDLIENIRNEEGLAASPAREFAEQIVALWDEAVTQPSTITLPAQLGAAKSEAA
jgi:hypothetical protein